MFVRKLEELNGTPNEMIRMAGEGQLHSRRILTKADGCGFSLSDVLAATGMSIDLWYKHQVEANLIVTGELEVTDLSNNAKWLLGAGDAYMVGPKDRHRITAKSDVHLVSVFCPPVLGNERHDEDGSFPPTGEIPPAWQGDSGRTMFIKRLADTRVVRIGHDRANAYRYLTQEDGCGFTVSTPRGEGGKSIVLWYQNHVEANYILEGEGTVEDKSTGETWDLAPGTVYVVGPKDRHQLYSEKGFYLLSIFNPPLVGDETHDELGGYPPNGPIPEAWRP